jgi:hypothetical protein
MKLEIEKTSETKDWRNRYFNVKRLELTLTGEDRPSEIRIYFADRALVFEKNLFEGLPYLLYRADPAADAHFFKLMPGLPLDRRYAFYYVKVDKPELLSQLELLNS